MSIRPSVILRCLSGVLCLMFSISRAASDTAPLVDVSENFNSTTLQTSLGQGSQADDVLELVSAPTQTCSKSGRATDNGEHKVNDRDLLPPPNPITCLHGDTVNLTGSYGTANVSKTFLGGSGGPTESLAIDAPIADANGWSFAGVSYRPVIKSDPIRGKVLFNTEDSGTYNAERRYDHGSAIPEQRFIYKAHYVRNVMLLDGAPYAKSYQWKHERINWENSISDGDCEIKVHNWLTQGSMSFVTRSASDSILYYGGPSSVPDSNGGWALMEIFVFTGTQGQTDGKVITRIHKNGKTVMGINRQTERVYADPAKRFRYFVEQNFFGNFGQTEDGVDNPLPGPQIRQLYSDDSRVIVGLDASTGWKRVELRDTNALSTATIREVQDWTAWKGNITVRLNTGGLSPGTHKLYLVVIDGLDSNGQDIVAGSQPVTVIVPPPTDTTAPSIPTRPPLSPIPIPRPTPP